MKEYLPFESSGMGIIYGQCQEGETESPFICDMEYIDTTPEFQKQCEDYIILSGNNHYKLIEALEAAITALNMVPSFSITALNMGSYKLLPILEATLKQARG